MLVPVKAFGRAKGRLDGHLQADERSRLARAMAEVVLHAAEPLGVVVVCDDDEVAAWARSRGAAVAWTPDLDLNGALDAAVERVAASGVPRAVIVHADLPFARDLARLADVADDTVVLVGDRHGEGTNAMSVPTDGRMAMKFGPGSLALHRVAAASAGLHTEVLDDERLAWDIDEPADLDTPPHLGPLPEHATSGEPAK